MTARRDLIRQHIPSMTNEDEETILDLTIKIDYDETVTAADLALRTCACGKKIDGFYEYVDHIEEVLK